VLEQALTDSPKQNGWNLTYHFFDYNLEFFEIGALDDPAWKAAAAGPHQPYMQRAGAARGGLWGNHGYEAAYAMVYQDADGSLTIFMQRDEPQSPHELANWLPTPDGASGLRLPP
jgi:hypothetical protein